MRKVKRWKYYCDFCKKSGGHRHWIEKHEKRCTLNPNRECGMCEIGGYVQEPIEKLSAIVKKYVKVVEDKDWPWSNYTLENDEALMKELGEAVEYCPACTLAAIRQAGVPVPVTSFDFKQACGEFWSAFNHERQDSYGQY